MRRIVDGERKAGDTKHRFRWDGRDDDGRRVPDGVYRMRVVRRDESRVINSTKKITVDTEPPRVELVSARAVADRAERARPEAGGAPPLPRARRTRRRCSGSSARTTASRGSCAASAATSGGAGVWRRAGGAGPDAVEPAPEGDYAFTVTVRDRAGNEARRPDRDPERGDRRARAPACRCAASRSRGPLDVVPAGLARALEVGPVDRSFDFALSRLGDPRRCAAAAGSAGASRSASRRRSGRASTWCACGRATSARSGRWRWPACPRRSAAIDRPRPLVVLPALTWQGLNPVDDDADGFADTLPSAGAVRLDRPFAGGGPAAALRVRDLAAAALARPRAARLRPHHGPRARARRGSRARQRAGRGVRRQRAVAARAAAAPAARLRRATAAASPRSAPTRSGARCLGDGRACRDPSPPRRRTAFGERTEAQRTASPRSRSSTDELGLFEGLSGFIGEFTVFELSRGLPDGARRSPRPGARRPARVRRPTSSATGSCSARDPAVGARARRVGAQPRGAAGDDAHLAPARPRRAAGGA